MPRASVQVEAQPTLPAPAAAGLGALAAWFTPPEVARLRKLRVGKVLTWIRTGELQAVNCAERAGARPRWRISAVALAEFDTARSNRARLLPRVPRTPKRRLAEVTQFF